MQVNPEDIKNKKFSSSFKGYNRGEVKEFISSIAQVLEELMEKNRQLSEQIIKLQQKLNNYQSKERQINTLLTSTREKANTLLKQSEEKATFIIKEAEIKAKKMQEEEERKLEKLKDEAKRLSHQKKIFLSKFKTLLRSQIELLKFYEEDSSLKGSNTPLPFSLSNSIKEVSLEED